MLKCVYNGAYNEKALSNMERAFRKMDLDWVSVETHDRLEISVMFDSNKTYEDFMSQYCAALSVLLCGKDEKLPVLLLT